ncbi:MAG TPA: LysR family transcriptional regulator [Ramlibacter sp.]|nr:LysR family transcriptional regulator [Ramlibacter sp.]
MDRLWAMEVFVRVAECGSFTRAADSIGLANGTVTTCVRNLERHMGVTLINRDTRRLRLTEEGETYLKHVREVLDAVRRSEEETLLMSGRLEGRINVEVTVSIARDFLWPRLPEFSKRFPSITVALALTNNPHNMIERAIDVAIRVGDVEDLDLVARPLFEASFVLCCSPEMAKQLPPHPRDLDPRRCIGILPEARHSPDRWLLHKEDQEDEEVEEVEVAPAGPLHFNTVVDAIHAAELGVGVACVLDVHARERLAAGRVVQVYPEWQTRSKTVYVVMPKSRTGSAKVRAFADFLLELAEGQRRPSSLRLVAVRPIGQR